MDTAVLSPIGTNVVRLDSRRPVPSGPRVAAVGAASPVRPTSPAGRAADGRVPTRSQPPLRLTTRGRVVVVALGLLLALAVSMVAARAVADAPASGGVEVVRHVVVEGETLWALADRLAAPQEDVRDVVVELVRLNGLPNAGLMAGQTIVLPVR